MSLSVLSVPFALSAVTKVASGSRRRWSAAVAVIFALFMSAVMATGQTAVGSSTTQTVTLNFTGPVTLNADPATAVRVTTQGAVNLDFSYLAGGTCTPGGTYSVGIPCTVKVTFAPRYPGQRVGAVSLYDTNGALVGQTNTSGTGTGPLGVIEVATPVTVATNSGSVGVSIDGVGNIYLSVPATTNRLYKYGLNPDGTYTRTTLETGLGTPGGTAVDNAGNLYYTVRNDGTGMGGVYELTPDQQIANGVAVEVAQGTFTPDNALAADAAGNLYFADVNTFQVYKIAPGLPVMRGATVYSAGVGERLAGLAVDPSGVIYAGGVTSLNIYKIAAGGASSAVYFNNFYVTNGLVLDAAGNLYLNEGTSFINKYLPGSTSGQTITNVRATNGLASDGAGTFYAVASNGALSVTRRTSAPLAENNTTIGYPSAAGSILLTNIGNAVLTPSSLTATSPFNVDASGTCVVGTAVAPAASCTIASTFTPPAAQAYTGTVTLVDDSPASVATKTVNVSGTGQVGTLFNFTVTLPATVVAGTPFTATFQANDQNGNQLPSYNATANLTSNDPQAIFPATATFMNGTASATVTFKTAGSSDYIQVKDPTTNRSGIKNTAVTPTALVSLTAPATATVGAGSTFNLALTGADVYGNVIANVPVNITVPATGSSATPLLNPAIATGNATFTQNAVIGSYTIGFSTGTLTASTAITVPQPDSFVVSVLTDPATGTAALCVNGNTASTYQTGGTTNAACSLRDAVAAANATSGSVISFAPGLATTSAPGSIPLTGVLTLTKAVTLTGPGSAALTLNGSGSGATGILQATASNTPVSMTGLTFLNATGPSITTGTTDDAVLNDIVVKGTSGTVIYAVNLQGVNTSILNSSFVSNATTSAAVFVRYGSALTNLVFDSNTTTAPTSAAALVFYGLGAATVRNATFANNTGVSAAALTKDNNGGGATITIANSTFSGNTATGAAGATIGRGNFVLRNITLYGNTHATGSVGPVAASGNVTVQNSILAGENGVTSAGTCSGCALAGNNLIGVDPLLSPLGNYGFAQPQSPVLQTLLPVVGSPAICGGLATADATDERGFARPKGTCYDIGAVQTAYTLAVTQQPTSAQVNAAITPPPAVQVTEHALTLSGAPINVTVSSGTLAGTASKTTDAMGTASFNNLSVNTPGSKTLTFTAGTLSVTSNAFTVIPPVPTVLLAVNPTTQTYGLPVALGTFTGSAMFNGNTVPGNYTYTATPTTGSAIVVDQGNTVLPASAYKVVASFTPTDTTSYSSASSSTTVTNYTVNPATAAITFTVANHTYGDAPFTVSATSASSGSLTYTVVSGPATVSGNTVTLSGAGPVVLQASQVADANYSANTQQTTFTVAPATAPITFSVPSHTFGDAPFTVSATSASSGSLTYTVVSGPATISGNTATLSGAGPVVLQASQVADANYSANTQQTTFTVAPATAPITFSVPSHTFGDAPFTVSATSASSGSLTYTVVSGPATISGNTVTLSGAGPVVLQASQAADANYSANTQQTTFTVAPATAPITFSVPNHTFGDAPFIVSATSNSAGTFTYSVVSGAAMISGTTVTLTGAGTVVLQTSQAANGSYTVNTKQATFTVAAPGVIATTVVVTSSANPSTGGASVTLTATVTAASGSTPAGSVNFTEGGSLLGSGTLNASGVATYTTAAFSVGAHTVTATYTPTSNNSGSSASITQTVNVAATASPFTFTTGDAFSYSATVTRGQATLLPLTFTPSSTFSGTVMFNCAGLPTGMACAFTPASLTLAAGSSVQTLSLLIQTETLTLAQLHAAPLHEDSAGSRLVLAFALPGVLLVGFGARSRRLLASQRLMMFGLLLTGMAVGVTGCGSNASSVIKSTTLAAPGTYNINIVATSGTSQTIPATITVQ